MSWSNSRKSFAEKQLDSMTITLPEEFTSKCVLKTEMVQKMQEVLETEEEVAYRKVHEPEAQLCIENVQTLVEDISDEGNQAIYDKYEDSINQIKAKLQEILNQNKNK